MKDKQKIIKVGIFVVLISIITVWGFGYLRNKHFFTAGNVYYAEYTDIKGLTISGVVYMNGFKIGDVTNLGFTDESSGKILVEFIIQKNLRVPQGSVAKISSLDIMGTRGIKLVRNEHTDKFHQSGDTLLSAVEADLSDQINDQLLPFKTKAEEMIVTIDSVMYAVHTILNPETRSGLKQSFAHLQRTLRNLESVSYSAESIIAGKKDQLQRIIDNAESITNNLENNNEQITLILDNFANISDSLARADVAGTLQKADNAIASLNNILGKVESGEGTLGMLVQNDSLHNNLNSAADELNKLIEDIKKRPDRYLHFSVVRVGGNK